MKMSFVTIGASDAVAAWSGIPFFMSQALAESGFDLDCIQRLKGPRSISLKARNLFRARILRQNYSTYRHPDALKFYSRQVERQLEEQNPDVVFACSTLPIAYLETNKPIVLWTDATFAGLLNFYPEYVDMSAAALGEGNAAEQAALDRCTLAVYSSEWAARSAIERYHADEEKVKVVPFGANFPGGLTLEQAEKAIEKRPTDLCKLLFLGVDWKRKGADVAVEVAERLNRRGIPTKLTMAGCMPPEGKTLPKCVDLAGFVSKNTTEGSEKLRRLLMDAHFLIVLSVADCTPIVFSEANSFAVPCISTDVGGNPSVVKNGVNGWVVHLANAAEESAEAIEKIFTDRESYRRLALSSYREYGSRLNWRTSAQTISELIHRFESSKR
jgi:glycosyltransferase involved in cell wall biosynthesis